MRLRKKWKKPALLLALFLACFVFGGCRFGKTEFVFSTGMTDNEVFSINEKSCSLTEAKVFLTNYQNIYAKVYDVNLWEHDFGNNSLEDYVKDLTISQLAQIMSMDFLAEQEEVSLSEEELDQVSEAAEAYYASLNEEEISYMGVSEGIIEDMYQEYGLANKIYAKLTTGVNDEVSDDEARVMVAMQIFVKSKDVAAEIEDKLKNGGDFASLAAAYNEAGEIEITFGRNKMPKEVEEKAFTMEDGEVSGCIAGDEGYYFIKCVDNYNQELTDANKKVIVEKRRKEAFDDVYEAFIKTLPSKFNEELWDTIQVEVKDDIKTSSFFETYEEYCKW